MDAGLVSTGDVSEDTQNESGAGSGSGGSETSDKPTSQVMFVVPNELKSLIDQRAESEGKSTSALLRELIADEFDFTLPLTTVTRVKKYANPEERKAAQAEKNKVRNALIKKLLAAHRSGAINLGDFDEDDDEDDDD